MELSVPHPEAGTYVIGATRFGKSSFLANRMLADAEARVGFALIDPKKDLADLVYGYLPNAIVLDVDSANFRINPFADLGGDPDVTLDQVMQIFTKLFDLSRADTPRLLQYLRNSAKLLIPSGGTLAQMYRL